MQGAESPELEAGQRVRLLVDAQGLTAGTEGVVVGFYARNDRTALVAFPDGTREVDPSALEPLEAPPA